MVFYFNLLKSIIKLQKAQTLIGFQEVLEQVQILNILLYTYYLQEMNGKLLREVVETALRKLVKKFKVEDFEAYLAGFQHTQDISSFIDDLYNNLNNLRLKKEDILQLLIDIGFKQDIKQFFGASFYIIWLEFYLIQAINLQQRLTIQQLISLPQARETKRPQILKDICLAHNTDRADRQRIQALRQLQKEKLFKEMIDIKDQLQQRYQTESRLKLVKKSILSDLNPKQTEIIFMQILQKIIQKIGTLTEKTDCQTKIIDIKELLDETLEKNNSFQREVLTCHLSQVIFSILGIQIKKNSCFLHDQTKDVTKERLQMFGQFFKFQRLIIEYERQDIKIEQLLSKMENMLHSGVKGLWYWPIYDKRSFIVFLIQECNKKGKMDTVIEQFNMSPPNLSTQICNIHQRQFLQQILTQFTPQKISLARVIKCLQKFAKNQYLDVQKQLKNGETYEILLKVWGIPISHISNNWSSLQEINPLDYFYIYCSITKKRQQIYISVDDRNAVVDKLKSVKCYSKLEYEGPGYNLTCQMTNSNVYGRYISGRKNLITHYKTDVKYQGILNYGNLQIFEQQIKKLSWKIIDSENWKEIKINAAECQIINSGIMKAVKKEKTLKIKLNAGTFQLDLQAMTVNLLFTTFINSEDSGSMVKKKFGYLVYLPTFKKQQVEEQFNISSDDQLNQSLIPKKTQKKQIPQQHEIVHRFDEIFYYLGVFKHLFEPSDSYFIDNNQHVHASTKKSIDYFKKWIQIQLHQMMGKNLLQNGSIYPQTYRQDFKLSKRLYPYVKKQLQILQQKLAPKKLQINYDQKSQSIFIQNLKEGQQANNFYHALITYLSLKVQEEGKKKNWFLQLDKDKLKHVQNSENSKIQIINRQNNMVELVCLRQQKQKLVKQLQSLEEVHQFTYEDSTAYKLMKQDDAKYLQSINIKQNQIGEDSFKVSMKLKDHPKFKQRLCFYHDRIEEQGGERMQQKISKQGKFLHIYRSEFNKQCLEVDVSKMGDDILLGYNKKIQKAVKRLLSKIEQAKQKEYFSYANEKGKDHVFRNVDSQLLYLLKDRLQNQIRQKSKQMQLNPVIQMNHTSKDQYSLKGSHISPEQQKIMSKQIENFNSLYLSYLGTKKQIIDMFKITNEVFKKIPSDKASSKYLKNIIYQFKKFLKQLLNEMITPIIEEGGRNLQKEFSDFLKNESLDAAFTSKQKDATRKKLIQAMDVLNIFEVFQQKYIKRIQEEQKKTSKIAIIQKEIAPTLQQAFVKFKDNTLKQQDLERYFKTLSILAKIYYGQQLPITEHLQKFNQLLQSNDAVIVKVGTGSGKSTVIPPYLVGLGYKKVIVTQPRRLPCHQIYKRVSDVFGAGICGYEIADACEDENNSLIYMTDGLLKMKALFDEKQLDKIDVLIIDEIHERSANIDILLLLLNQYYKVSKRKLKLVLCSATIDKNIGKILQDANLKIGTFEVKVQRHPITEVPIKTGNILGRILQLAGRLEGDQQLLAFFPGVRQVLQIVNLLKNKYNYTAFPIMAEQSPVEQDKFLKSGRVFIATSIAQTSLTFHNLRFVVDSRMSRCRIFNPEVELMETQESFSSNSSIQQRKGRLGRTCPGQYHHFDYHSNDFTANPQYNRTELQNNDLTNNIFELMLRQESTFNSVYLLMKKLNHNQQEFDQKFNYSRKILQDLGIIQNNDRLSNKGRKMIQYGNLGNPQHNYAIYLGSLSDCTINMVYIVSFLMLGVNRSGQILRDLKAQSKGGDLKTIHDFIADVADKIKLKTTDPSQIKQSMKRNCKNIVDKPWFKVVHRIMMKAKQLLKTCINNVPSSNWEDVVTHLLMAYRNKVFFNQSIFGGNKANYEKIRKKQFNFETKDKLQTRIIYKIDMNSLANVKDNPPKAILSLNCAISPESECVLSLCEKIQLGLIREDIVIGIIGCECTANYFKDSQPIKEQELFDKLKFQMRSKYNSVDVQYNFPEMKFVGKFQALAKAFSTDIEIQRRNKEVKINIKTILQEAIDKRIQRAKDDKMMADISKDYSLSLLQKLTNYEFRKMFQTTKFEMLNNFEVDIEWDVKNYDAILTIKNSKNLHIKKIIEKLTNFCRWFADSQTICKDQLKSKFLTKEERQGIMQRVNQIVDSRLDHHIIKGWANGNGPQTRYPRTARMIAAAWVLTNTFHCVVKGGFVRDWVVNKQQVLPPKGMLPQLLKVNARNGYRQVQDDSVTPSDIDAELSENILFDSDRFIKQMKKLNILVKIEEDGWRKHIIFDDGVASGGFTADLIQPYTSMCHDTYDFDVNILYIKKDHLNAIGQKIPLEYQGSYGKTIKIELEQLLSNCRKKKMRKLKDNIWKYRYEKFEARKWTINKEDVYQPLVYKDYTTKSSPIDISCINKIAPAFLQKIPNAKIVKIQSLKNKAWDDAFESIEHWIITEMERSQKSADPVNYQKKNINSNNKMLFHGSKTAGIEGIKQFGFDSRFFAPTGYYGRGAYFADDPSLSYRFTDVNPDTKCRQMFVVNVALGKQQTLNVAANTKMGPSKGYHSILGKAGGHTQYIIQRWGQAKPMYLISFQA